MAEMEKYYESAAEGVSNSIKSQMFGKPCYKLDNGKAFCCLFEDNMVFKLGGNAHVNALELKGAQLFDPSGKGRPMKEWVQVPSEHKDRWSKLAGLAAEYVGGN